MKIKELNDTKISWLPEFSNEDSEDRKSRIHKIKMGKFHQRKES